MLKTDVHQDLQQCVEKIHQSGALGRSPTYRKLLEYLSEKTIDGDVCSEISVALDVFDKDETFDVTSDSTVRVYIYNLRKKLDNYYEKQGLDDDFRLQIPKGEYRLIVTKQSPQMPDIDSKPSGFWWARDFSVKGGVLFGLAFIALATLILLLTNAFRPGVVDSNPSDQQLRFWGTALTDDKPIKIVIGDYYIFGETLRGDDYRLVREFYINSPTDLENSARYLNPDSDAIRFDLGLTYLPRGSAFALATLLQVSQKSGKTPKIEMMSELDANDLREHHIFYIGYISGLDVLEEYTFSASKFEVGFSYDELIDTELGISYVSSLIDAEEKRNFIDYGILASYSLAEGNRVVIVAGTRDAGLMEMSELAITKNLLSQMELEKNPEAEAFFSVYEVNGFNLTNVNSSLVSSQYLDTENITRD